jgi:hypothetical protein
MSSFNANQFRYIYKHEGIDLDELGCIMLDLEVYILKIFEESSLYYTKDPKKFWINGFVANKTPHITLLYGLLQSGNKYRTYIDEVLKGWSIKTVTVKEVGYFESPYENEPYYCIVAHIDITPELLEGHERLQMLPHIDTFPGYKAHMTLAYIRKDEKLRDETIDVYNTELKGKELKVKGLNYGGNESE